MKEKVSLGAREKGAPMTLDRATYLPNTDTSKSSESQDLGVHSDALVDVGVEPARGLELLGVGSEGSLGALDDEAVEQQRLSKRRSGC